MEETTAFTAFALDHPEYQVQAWQVPADPGSIRELLADPHRWIRTRLEQREPGQWLGLRKDVVNIQFVYPSTPVSEEEFLVTGLLDTNQLTIYTHPLAQLTADDFAGEETGATPETPTQIRMLLHRGLAYSAHYPLREYRREALLDYLLKIARAPHVYIETLNRDPRFTLVAEAPQGVSSPITNLPDRLQLTPQTAGYTGLRFLYQWAKPEATDDPIAECSWHLSLSGTYDPSQPATIHITTLAHLVGGAGTGPHPLPPRPNEEEEEEPTTPKPTPPQPTPPQPTPSTTPESPTP